MRTVQVLAIIVVAAACGPIDVEGEEIYLDADGEDSVESALSASTVKFSVAGPLSQTLLNQIVSPAHQVRPYQWGIWGANDDIGMINSCKGGQTLPRTLYPYPCWDKAAFGGWGGFAKKECTSWNASNVCTATRLTSQVGTSKPGEELLRERFRAKTASTIWLVGNEPDNFRQDNLLDPVQYARMMAVAADQWRWAWGKWDQQSRMVFGQITYARSGIKEWSTSYPNVTMGLDYLKLAYAELKRVRRNNSAAVARDIFALSTHEYIGRVVGQHYLHWQVELRRKDWDPTKPDLWDTMSTWVSGLEEFRNWSNTVDGGLLADKPLYLTEFGALDAFCPSTLLMNGHPNPGALGEACPAPAVRGDNDYRNDHVFYGRQNDEGLWGMASWQMFYLKQHQADWKHAYFFVNSMGKVRGECVMTVWLSGDKLDCTSGRDATLSVGGKRYADALRRLGIQ